MSTNACCGKGKRGQGEGFYIAHVLGTHIMCTDHDEELRLEPVALALLVRHDAKGGGEHREHDHKRCHTLGHGVAYEEIDDDDRRLESVGDEEPPRRRRITPRPWEVCQRYVKTRVYNILNSWGRVGKRRLYEVTATEYL